MKTQRQKTSHQKGGVKVGQRLQSSPETYCAPRKKIVDKNRGPTPKKLEHKGEHTRGTFAQRKRFPTGPKTQRRKKPQGGGGTAQTD